MHTETYICLYLFPFRKEERTNVCVRRDKRSIHLRMLSDVVSTKHAQNIRGLTGGTVPHSLLQPEPTEFLELKVVSLCSIIQNGFFIQKFFYYVF